MAKTKALPVRLAPHIRAQIEEVAKAQGQSLSSFLESAGYEKAKRILDEQHSRKVIQALASAAT
jgi:uncharacterized protein (DUF1778 family)